MMRPLMFSILLVAGTTAQAQTLYKCMGADGVRVYQQVPCAAEQKAEAAIDYKADRSRPKPAYTQHLRGRGDLQDTGPSRTEPVGAPTAAGGGGRNMGPSGACPPGQVPLNASRSNPSSGWNAKKGYVPLQCGAADGALAERAAPRRHASPEPAPAAPPIIRSVDTGFGNRKYIDQYGKVYQSTPIPGTNQTRVRGQDGTTVRCTTDGFGNERCN